MSKWQAIMGMPPRGQRTVISAVKPGRHQGWIDRLIAAALIWGIAQLMIVHQATAQVSSPPAVGTTGSAGVLSGTNWLVCRADSSTAWLTSSTGPGSEGVYDAIAACQSLGYATVAAFGGTCGTSCGYCGTPGLENYDGGGGPVTELSFTVQWQCAGTLASVDPTDTTKEETARFALDRARNLLRSQPDLTRLASGPQSPISVAISSSGDSIRMNLVTESSTWATLSGRFTNGTLSESQYIFGAIGQQWALSQGLTVGAMLQFDDSRLATNLSRIEGQGWLVGPYAVGKLASLPLYLEASLLWGRTDNTLTMSGAAPVDFGSDRSLATLKFSGVLPMGPATVYPSIAIAHTEDRQHGFIDAAGNTIDPQDVWLTEARYGANFSMPLPQADGRVLLTGGLFGVYGQSGGTGATTALTDALDGSSLSGNLGLDITLASGGKLSFGAYVDGIGASGEDTYGGSVRFSLKF